MLMLCLVTVLFLLGYSVLTCHETPVLQAVSLHVFSVSLFFSLFPLCENIVLTVTLENLTAVFLILKSLHHPQRNPLGFSL